MPYRARIRATQRRTLSAALQPISAVDGSGHTHCAKEITEKTWPAAARSCAVGDCVVSPSIPQRKESAMNWDRVEGNWRQLKGKVKEQWGKLTDDQLDEIAGKRDQLIGRIQKAYGVERDVAERQVNDWESRL
jgi:uncharacterized protein YjbJ (UPF0337 family)